MVRKTYKNHSGSYFYVNGDVKTNKDGKITNTIFKNFDEEVFKRNLKKCYVPDFI